MKKSIFFLFVLVISAMMVLAACASAPATSGGGAARPAAPAEFANKTNPVAGNADAVAKGKAEYTTNCASCHGESGAGDGPAGSALNPKPGKLNSAVKEVSAGYLFWRVTTGGGMDPFKSSMPSFKGVLSEEKIWQVISYIQTWK